MDTQMERRLTAAAGIVSVVILLVGQSLVLNAPTIDKPPAEIRAWAVDHRAMMLTAMYLLVFGFSVALVFWAGTWRELRAKEGGSGLLSNTGLAAVVLLTALLAAGFAFSAELGFRGAGLTDDSARMLNDLTLVSLNLSNIATAVALTAFAVVIIRSGAFAPWLGWLGLVAAAVHLVGGASFAHSGFLSPQGIGLYVAPLLYYAWVVAASVLTWRLAASAGAPSVAVPAGAPGQ